MNVAWISGRSGRAVIEAAGETFLLVDGDEGPPVACSPRHLYVQWSTYADVSGEDAGTFPFSRARASLAKAVAADRAHLYVLGLLDVELEHELRSDLAADLESLLAERVVVEWVHAMLRSMPLPASADLHSAIDLAAARGASRVVSLLAGLEADAPLIERACAAWAEFASSLKSDSDADVARRWFARTGGFHKLVEGLRRDSREPFAAWMLSVGRSVPREFGPVPLKALQHIQVIAGLPTSTIRDTAGLYVREDTASIEPRRPQREGRRPRLAGREVLARVTTQIEEIVQRLEAGDEKTAERFLGDLLEFQREHDSTPEQRAKTLCNIAAQARSMGRLDFAERSLRQALAERPDDAWAHSQLSVVLRAGGRFDEAHEAAKLGEAYGTDSGVLLGTAEALKAQLRYAEALEKYDEAVERFPDDVFAWTGRAEILKALGEYDEALDSYNEIIERFPDNVVARNGRAEVLKALGRYDEALDSYDDTIEHFPDHVFAWTGRAEVLKALGQYDKALHRYNDTIERFPNNVVARTGWAEVLKALGQYDEALNSYNETIEQFPDNVVARNGRAEVLKALGRYDEALDSYRDTIERFPNNAFARNGRGYVLLLAGRFEDAIRSLPSAEPRTREDWIALHIRGMAKIRLGLLDEAREIFRRGANNAPSPQVRDYFRNTLAAVELRQLRFREVIRDLSPIVLEMSAEQRTTATVLLAHASAALNETRSAQRWLDETTSTRVPAIVDLRTALAERYALKVVRRSPLPTQATAEIDRFIHEQEFRLLALAQAA